MIDFTGVKAITIPEGKVKKIVRKSDGVQIWAGVNNVIASSINPDGTPYRGVNGEIGYKSNYKINSALNEATANGCYLTGYIPAAPKDVFYLPKGLYPYDTSEGDRSVVLYDANFTVLKRCQTKAWYPLRNNSQLISEGLSFHDDGSGATFTPYCLRYWLSLATVNQTAYVRFVTRKMDANTVITKNEPID